MPKVVPIELRQEREKHVVEDTIAVQESTSIKDDLYVMSAVKPSRPRVQKYFNHARSSQAGHQLNKKIRES